MLKSLYLKNYVLFDEVSLDFNDGFYAVTGDTGAGKSLIIDALNYLTGARLTESIVRKGTDRCIIEAVFEFHNPETHEFLLKAGYELQDQYIVSREVNIDNKSVSRLNHRVVNLSFLNELFKFELDIHNQHENQKLLEKRQHLSLLDNYIKTPLLQELTEAYQELNFAKKELEKFKQKSFNEDEIAFFKAQIQEIDEHFIQEEQYNKLLEKQNFYRDFENIFSSLTNIRDYLNQNQGIVELLFEMRQEAQNIDNLEQYENIIKSIDSLYFEADDLNNDLAQILSSLDFDEYDLNNIEEILFNVNRLIRKHGGSFESLNDKYYDLKQSVDSFEARDLVIRELENNVQKAQDHYLQLAREVSNFRFKHKKELEEDLHRIIRELKLEQAHFQVSIKEGDYRKSGFDDVEFLVAMNPGEDLKPIAAVASGGELSRIMLALKVLFSAQEGIRTIIFDEIDTGVSGNVASAIGKQMKKISKNTQVFAVTHLAQVAAFSDVQLYVTKETTDNKTFTTIEEVSGDRQIKSLAYLAFGNVTQQSIKAAEELLKKAQTNE